MTDENDMSFYHAFFCQRNSKYSKYFKFISAILRMKY